MVFDTTSSNTGAITIMQCALCGHMQYNYMVRYIKDFFSTYRNCVPFLGSNEGACIHLLSELGTPLLWFACRQHVGEIILTHVWESLRIEASKSPEVSIFKRYRFYILIDN